MINLEYLIYNLVDEAKKVLMRLHERLGRKHHGEDYIRSLFSCLNLSKDNLIDQNEFRNVLQSQLS